MTTSATRLFLIGLIVLSSFTGCQSSTKQKADHLESTDAYEVRLPEGPQPDKGWPLLIAIDPHGSGKTAVDHLKDAVANYPAVLVASNRIQNNDPNYIAELNALIIDIAQKYPVSEQVYLVGFSGGARMALTYARSHPVAGVLAAGAFAGPEELQTIQCPVMGLIGMDDFNFSEAAAYLFHPEKLPSPIHIELTNASHEWPDADRLTKAWAWFRLADNAANKTAIDSYVQRQQQRIDSLTQTGNLLQAACLGRNMGTVSAFNTLSPFHQNTNALIQSPAYQQQLKALGESLQLEMKIRQQLAQSLFEKDESWWINEIATLHEHEASETDLLLQMAWKRLSGFLGIICYSYSRQLLSRKDTENLKQVLMVYRLAEPENPDMKHFAEELDSLLK